MTRHTAAALVSLVGTVSGSWTWVTDDDHRLLLTRDWEEEEEDSGLEPEEPTDLENISHLLALFNIAFMYLSTSFASLTLLIY